METKEQRFSRIVEEYKRTIYTVCYMFSKDEDEVNDLFQEILIRLWQGFDSFEGKSDIKTWIYRVSLNFCLNYDKKQKRTGSNNCAYSIISGWLRVNNVTILSSE